VETVGSGPRNALTVVGGLNYGLRTEIASRTERVARSRAVSKENDGQSVGRVVLVTGVANGGRDIKVTRNIII